MTSIRLMLPSERPFVASAWLRSYEHAEVMTGHIPRDDYWRAFGRLVDALLDSSDTYVAHNPEDPEHFLGFACRSKTENTLHYVYAKWAMRDRQTLGSPLLLASKLIGEAGLKMVGLRCTFSTVAWLKWCAKHGVTFEHDRSLVSVTRAAIRRSPREERT